MKFKSLILLACVAALSACSFDKSEGLDAANEIEIREKAKRAYAPIVGTYEGSMQQGKATRVARVRLYMLEVDGGSNPNGANGKRILLRANFSTRDPLTAGKEFDARYFESKHEIVMTSSETTTNDDIHTIQGKIENSRIVGKATTRGGSQWNIDLPLTSRESADQGGTTEDNEYYDNLRKEYQAIAGKYQGDLINADGTLFMTATIRLQIHLRNSENGKYSIPYIMGIFHDIKDVYGSDPITNEPAGMSDLTLTGIYNTEVIPRRLDLSGTPVFGNSKFLASLELVLVDGELRGIYQQSPILARAFVNFKRVAPAKTDEN